MSYVASAEISYTLAQIAVVEVLDPDGSSVASVSLAGDLDAIAVVEGSPVIVQVLPKLYETTFTQANLTGSVYYLTHGLGGYPSSVILWDSNGNQYQPYDSNYQTEDVVAIDFTGLTPLTGTHKALIGR